MSRLNVGMALALIVQGGALSVAADNGARPGLSPALAAFNLMLQQLDQNHDGKLSKEECLGLYRDKKMAEERCSFWDTDKDGQITAEEYVQMVQSLKNK